MRQALSCILSAQLRQIREWWHNLMFMSFSFKMVSIQWAKQNDSVHRTHAIRPWSWRKSSISIDTSHVDVALRSHILCVSASDRSRSGSKIDVWSGRKNIKWPASFRHNYLRCSVQSSITCTTCTMKPRPNAQDVSVVASTLSRSVTQCNITLSLYLRLSAFDLLLTASVFM